MKLITVALIRRLDSGGSRWLGRINASGDWINFVLGFPADLSALRESVSQEVAWEYGLDPSRDFLVSNMAQVNFEFPESVPAVADQIPLHVSFYNVQLYRREIRERLQQDPRNIWLTSEEIWAGESSDGLPLSRLIHQLVTGSEVIQQWESSL